MKEIEVLTPEEAELYLVAPEKQSVFQGVNVENFYIYNKNGEKFLDLTCNLDNNPLGYCKLSKEISFFLESSLIISTKAEEFERLICEKINFTKTFCFSSKIFAKNFISKTLQKHIDKTSKDKILISAVDNNQIVLPKSAKTEFINLNDKSAIKTFFTKSVGAVIIEIYGFADEILIADYDYLKLVKEYCDKHRAILIYDCSNFSPLRLGGELFNFTSEFQPDILLFGKGLSFGLPFYSVALNHKAFEFLEIPDNTGILSCAYDFASDFINNYEKNKSDLLNISEYIEEKLSEISETYITLADFQRYGGLFFLSLGMPAKEFISEMLEKKIIINNLSDNKVYFMPPYNLNKETVDFFISAICELFDKEGISARLR